MAELADALDLGSSVNRRAGSTPVIRTGEFMAYVIKVSHMSFFYDILLKETVH